MEIMIQPVGGERAALESLADWLRGEPELAGRVSMTMPNPPEGALGAASDTLVVALGSGGALSVLAASLKAWLGQPRGSSVTILVKSGKGRSAEITADRVDGEQVEAIVRQVLGGPASGD